MRAIDVTRRAQRQIAAAARWWVANRDKASRAFAEDLDETLARIAGNAGIGIPIKGGIRRVLMERVRYYLYYRISDDDRSIEVLALWHASRRPPRV